MEWMGLKGWKWSKDGEWKGCLERMGRMEHYLHGRNWRTVGIGLMGGKVSEVLVACGRVKGVERFERMKRMERMEDIEGLEGELRVKG